MAIAVICDLDTHLPELAGRATGWNVLLHDISLIVIVVATGLEAHLFPCSDSRVSL